MLKLKKLRMPLPVTINDCVLLWQMGYRVEINDGRVIAVVKESKKKTALKPQNYYQLYCITDAVECQGGLMNENTQSHTSEF